MKAKFTLLTILGCMVWLSCGTPLTKLSNGKSIDPQLVGVWTGAEQDQQVEGISKQWEMTRKADGSFILDFTWADGGNKQKAMETGNWWITGNKFHEYHKESGKTDVYKYKVLDKAHVQYTAVKMALAMNAKIYSFIDTLKQDNTNSDFDDPAFDKAIKVNSITEEYGYVKADCEGCKFVKQSLVHRKKQSYDVLTVEKLDGSTVDYYFDITSFFGKF